MPIRTERWTHWTGSTLEIVDLSDEAAGILEGLLGSTPRRSCQLQYPNVAQSVVASELERKIRSHYRKITSVEMEIWVPKHGQSTFPTESDVASQEPGEREPGGRGWKVGAASEPIGVRIRLSTDHGACLQLFAASQAVLDLAFGNLIGLLSLGSRSRLASPVDVGSLTACGVAIGLVLGVARTLQPTVSPAIAVPASLAAAAGAGALAGLWTGWAVPRLEIRRDGEQTRWTRSRALALDLLGIAAGLAGVILAIVFASNQ